jgi:hypothetical protein
MVFCPGKVKIRRSNPVKEDWAPYISLQEVGSTAAISIAVVDDYDGPFILSFA